MHLPTFLETPEFQNRWKALQLTDEDLSALQWELIHRPESGVVIAGTGGFRKLRFVPTTSSKGSSGALRVIYVVYANFHTFVLGTLYAKNEISNISAGGKKQLKAVGEAVEAQILKRFRRNKP